MVPYRRPGPEQHLARMAAAAAVASLGWVAAWRGYPLLAVLSCALMVSGVRAFISSNGPGSAHALAELESQRINELTAEVAVLKVRLAKAQRKSTEAAAGVSKAAQALVGIEEDVRAVINAELHDTVSQTLPAIAYLTLDESVSREQLWEQLKCADEELRAVMANQSPLHTENVPLNILMKRMIEDYVAKTGLEIVTEWPAEEFALSTSHATGLYRFVHEGLSNIAKHAQASFVRVSVRIDGTDIHADVSDDGVGFDMDLLEKTSRMGLRLLRRRCMALGAAAQVISAPGAGTTYTLHIPQALVDPEIAASAPQPAPPKTLRLPPSNPRVRVPHRANT